MDVRRGNISCSANYIFWTTRCLANSGRFSRARWFANCSYGRGYFAKSIAYAGLNPRR